jgi:hypothetical protein
MRERHYTLRIYIINFSQNQYYFFNEWEKDIIHFVSILLTSLKIEYYFFNEW